MNGPLHTMAGREPDLDTSEERENFYQEVCIAVFHLKKYTTHLSQAGQSESR